MNLGALVDDFIKKTGDSPTHIVVSETDYADLSPSLETDTGTLVDLIPYKNVHGHYHHLELPLACTLPQFKAMRVFKVAEYEEMKTIKVSRLERFMDWGADNLLNIFIGTMLFVTLLGVVWMIRG